MQAFTESGAVCAGDFDRERGAFVAYRTRSRRRARRHPVRTALLVLIRPVSGSAALAVGAELMGRYGPDSLIGRTAAVMLGSTETTFYTVSVYFGAAGIRKTRYAVPAALLADLTGFLAASWAVRLFS